MSTFKTKVVGLSFHDISSPVVESDYVILRADPTNEFDSNAICVLTGNQQIVGFVANSSKTLSDNNIANGNLSATELKEVLSFENREYYAKAINVHSSCIYLEINPENWSYINKPNLEFVRASELVETEVVEVPAHKVDIIEPIKVDTSLVAEIAELKLMVAELLAEVKALKTAIDEGDNSPSTPSSDRVMYSFVGLSHFEGQNYLDGQLTIVEEPIFEGAKGTAVYLKSEDYRIGVSPSAKKKQYCEDHNIPYCENKSLKGKVFGGDIKIEEMVPDEYIVVSV
ncbi:HIRAN domain-containing protein [uncultured Methanobrevibacter sp.]|uniref:HIRAN domain-containing protein n=1 Tax=uncultured Methanobrevibacter sp. TaxID=253161 RepID=UPI0025D58EF5|nr:HIRAN domain-containing protein [uncultured Methanobrevibacter sp.]